MLASLIEDHVRDDPTIERAMKGTSSTVVKENETFVLSDRCKYPFLVVDGNHVNGN